MCELEFNVGKYTLRTLRTKFRNIEERTFVTILVLKYSVVLPKDTITTVQTKVNQNEKLCRRKKY